MTLVMEDGNGLPTANSYANVAYADAYFTLRGITAWTGSDAVKEAALIRATDYIETVNATKFKGTPAFVSDPPNEAEDQALSFPRDTRVPAYGADSIYFGELEKPVVIPAVLKKATCEYALRALTASLLNDPVTDESGALVTSKTEQVGPIRETTQYYASGGIEITQPYPAADLLLVSLLKTSGTVIRG